MKTNFPNYNDSVVSLANSIRKHFDLEVYHNTLSDLDDVLKKDYKNVVVILYDGMGSHIFKKVLRNSFFNKHFKRSISSVLPSTTTASTTSIQTGLYPSEHNWLGWNIYLEPIDEIFTLYTNKIKDTDIDVRDYHVGNRYIPYKTIVDEINEKGKYEAYALFPFGDDCYNDVSSMYERIIDLTKTPGKKYIYAYYDNPDALMHDYGIGSFEMKENIKMLNKKTKEMCEKLEDTLVIVTADHGHINVKDINLDNYPDFKATLNGDIALEGRCCSFRVNDKEKFELLFNKYFSKDFILKTHDEALNEKIFGDGTNKYLDSTVGDYIAIATTDKMFSYKERDVVFKSAHAGITIDEMEVPLIIIER